MTFKKVNLLPEENRQWLETGVGDKAGRTPQSWNVSLYSIQVPMWKSHTEKVCPKMSIWVNFK